MIDTAPSIKAAGNTYSGLRRSAIPYSSNPMAIPSKNAGHNLLISPAPHVFVILNKTPYTVSMPAGTSDQDGEIRA